MFKLLLLLFLTVVIHVQPQSNDDWFYDMGDDWEVSNTLKSFNPYYSWYTQAAKQMAMYGYAKHVGKINRGQFFNPELNMPANRAFGYQSDFNPQDFNSGAFKYKPQGQKFRAKAVHVNEGLANYVGEVRTMPIGQHVQEDGTILVQTPYKGDPCRPNPCNNVRMSTCTAVNTFTAKCSRSKSYKLTLSWADPYSADSTANDLDLLLVADYHDGSSCAAVANDASVDFLEFDDIDCGAVLNVDAEALYTDIPNLAEESATLTTLADGTNYKSYTYAVIACVANLYNPTEGNPTLTVEYNGQVKQTLAIPQFKTDGTNINYEDTATGDFRRCYFFGCFRPQLGYVDTRGAGFHDATTSTSVSTVVTAGLGIFSPGLCKATLSWSSGYGFNPYEQSGSGDENYSV